MFVFVDRYRLSSGFCSANILIFVSVEEQKKYIWVSELEFNIIFWFYLKHFNHCHDVKFWELDLSL